MESGAISLNQKPKKNYTISLSSTTAGTIIGGSIPVTAEVSYDHEPVGDVLVNILDADDDKILGSGKTDKNGHVIFDIRVDKPTLKIKGKAVLEDQE